MRLRHDRQDTRRTEAAERNSYWAGMPAKDKLAALDKRLGKDVGARKQRARIAVSK